MSRRGLKDLLSAEPAWPLVQEWVADAEVPIEVLEPDQSARADTLVALQVTTRSTLGAIAYETGGLLVDRGWVRLLGSGHRRLTRTLISWNHGRSWTNLSSSAPLMLVADDVLGGFFAINGGAFPENAGDIFYFAPDTLAWEHIDTGYTGFVAWLLSGGHRGFYGEYRWPGWEAEILDTDGDSGLLIYPFLWAEGPALELRPRKPVPIAELYDLQMDMARQLSA